MVQSSDWAPGKVVSWSPRSMLSLHLLAFCPTTMCRHLKCSSTIWRLHRGFQYATCTFVTTTLQQYSGVPPWSSLAKQAIVWAVLLEEGEHGEIQPWQMTSSSTVGAGLFFVGNKDATLRACIDYWGLKDISIKSKYHLALLASALGPFVPRPGTCTMLRIRPPGGQAVEMNTYAGNSLTCAAMGMSLFKAY